MLAFYRNWLVCKERTAQGRCNPSQESRVNFSRNAGGLDKRLIRTKSVEEQLLAGFLSVQHRSEIYPMLDTVEYRFLMQVRFAISCQDNQQS